MKKIPLKSRKELLIYVTVVTPIIRILGDLGSPLLFAITHNLSGPLE